MHPSTCLTGGGHKLVFIIYNLSVCVSSNQVPTLDRYMWPQIEPFASLQNTHSHGVQFSVRMHRCSVHIGQLIRTELCNIYINARQEFMGLMLHLPSVSTPPTMPWIPGRPSRVAASASSAGVRSGGAGPPPVSYRVRLVASIFCFAVITQIIHRIVEAVQKIALCFKLRSKVSSFFTIIVKLL